MTLAAEEREAGTVDTWWTEIEQKYGQHIPAHRKRAQHTGSELTFYRNNLSYKDIQQMSKEPFTRAADDAINYDTQESLFGYDLDATDGCTESCEIF